jgi:polyisoprenoid-binding protein YceI
MKKILSVVFLTIFFAQISQKANCGDIYKIDPSHATIMWSVSHFGFSENLGKFSDISGTVNLDEKNPQNSAVEITVNTNSLLTGLSKLDEVLKGSDFFNVEKFPTATFSNLSIEEIEKNKAKIRGNLTLLGVQKAIILDVKINKIGINPISQRKTIGISASTAIKRSEFGMKFGLPGISDNVKIRIEVEANLASQSE